MNCSCGFNFALHRANDGELESYAVVSDKKYQKFLKREMKVLKAPQDDPEKRFRLIFKSSRLIGSLQRCPDCSRYCLHLPGQEETIILARDS